MTAQPQPQVQHVWYYQKSTLLGVSDEGPFTDAQLLQLAKDNQLTLATPIRSPSRTKNQWIKAESIQALAVAINQGRMDAEAKKRAAAEEKRAQKEELAVAKQQAKAEAEKAKALERQARVAQDAKSMAAVSLESSQATMPPLKSHAERRQDYQQFREQNPKTEQTLFDGHPAMFKNDPVRFVVYCLLCLVIVGIPLLIIWWFTCKAERLTVTTLKTTQRKGLFSKHTTEVWHRDVRNVQVRQSFFQRIFGVGSIAVSSAGQGGLEIDFSGIANPERVKQLIDNHR